MNIRCSLLERSVLSRIQFFVFKYYFIICHTYLNVYSIVYLIAFTDESKSLLTNMTMHKVGHTEEMLQTGLIFFLGGGGGGREDEKKARISSEDSPYIDG